MQKMPKIMGVKGEIESRLLTIHEIDATIGALTAYFYTQVRTDAIGNEEEGHIVIPKLQDGEP